MRLSFTTDRQCRQTLRSLQSYLDDECDPDRLWQVARHLSSCRDCYADAERFRQIKESVARLRCSHNSAAMTRLRELVYSLDPV